MNNDDKALLLKDLSARLPFRIYANLPNHHLVSHKYIIHDINIRNGWTIGILDCAGRIQIYSAKVEDIKPYLRPISLMTDEEKEELKKLSNEYLEDWTNSQTSIDKWKLDAKVSYKRAVFYNSHHIDWNDLIPKGLGIAVTEENNPYKE